MIHNNSGFIFILYLHRTIIKDVLVHAHTQLKFNLVSFEFPNSFSW